jgi:phage terminase large subunit-like protein
LPGTSFEGGIRRWPGLRGSEWRKAWSDDDKALYLADNSFIEFKSYEQGREAFQGPVRHVIRMDEEPDEDINEENKARQATVGLNIIYSMTPLNFSLWLYSDIYQKSVGSSLIECFEMSMYDNPYADPETVKYIEDNITDPLVRAARIYGKFTVAEGRVYKEYGDHNYIVPFNIPTDWPRMFVIDAHQVKDTYVLWRATAPSGKRFYYREAQIKGNVDHICHEIKARNGGDEIDVMLIDPSARQSAGVFDKGPLISYFKRHFPGLVEANNNNLLGRDAVMRAVANGPNGPESFVFRAGLDGIGCAILDHQMRNLSYKPPMKSGESRGKPEIVKKNDEGPDCMRYSEMYSFQRRGGNSKFKGWNIGVYAN